MKREAITDAATIEEALQAGLLELGAAEDDVEYEVLDEPGKRLFGAVRQARVRVWMKEEDAEEAESPEDEDLPQELVAEPVAVEPAVSEPEEEPLTDDQLDEIADAGVAATQSILAGFGIEATIDEYEGDDGEIILDIVGGDLGILIGRHGKTLDAMQTLVSALTNRAVNRRYPVLVDVEGYRSRRRVKLEDIAKRTAERVARQGRPVKLRPMSSYERKVVHVALREDRRVVTVSEGEEPFRQVVVSPKYP
jgi:spoIIIJ-associated protein